MWDESINPDTSIANFTGELGKEIATKGSFHSDYAELCSKYNIVPCPFIQVSNGSCRISNCAIDISSWRAMLLVVANVVSLEITAIAVHNCRLSSQHITDLAATSTEKGFKYVKFDYLDLSEETKQSLAAFLAADVKVEYVSMRGCGLNDAIITSNTALLQANFNLKGLNLSDNEITDAGMTALFTLLRWNVALKEISVGKNRINGEGWFEMLTALLVGSPSTKEDDEANKGVTKSLAEANKKIKDANKKRKKDKLPDLPEIPGPSKDRIIKVDGALTLVNRNIAVIDLGKNPLRFDVIQPSLEKMKGSCGPSSVTTAFGPCSLSLLLSKPTTGDSTAEVSDIIIDTSFATELEGLGVSLLI